MHHQIIINNTEKLFTTNLKKRKQKVRVKNKIETFVVPQAKRK